MVEAFPLNREEEGLHPAQSIAMQMSSQSCYQEKKKKKKKKPCTFLQHPVARIFPNNTFWTHKLVTWLKFYYKSSKEQYEYTADHRIQFNIFQQPHFQCCHSSNIEPSCKSRMLEWGKIISCSILWSLLNHGMTSWSSLRRLSQIIQVVVSGFNSFFVTAVC